MAGGLTRRKAKPAHRAGFLLLGDGAGLWAGKSAEPMKPPQSVICLISDKAYFLI